MTTSIGYMTASEGDSKPAHLNQGAETNIGFRRILLVVVMAATAITLASSVSVRWRLARDTHWQCDELPLLMQFTGFAGQSATQARAEAFVPTLWTWMSGMQRAVHIPRSHVSLHTTTGFWINHSIHLFGVTPWAGRIFPLAFGLMTIPIVAWAAWIVTRSGVATWLAAWLMALAPQNVVYSAQARGYAEAMALAPLLLVLLELYRRRPGSRLRALGVLVCALQMALTVYTSWVYWVLPILWVAAWRLPRETNRRAEQQSLSLGLCLIAICATMSMAVYTLDRWRLLTFASGRFGNSIENWEQFFTWWSRSFGELAFAWPMILPFAAFGALTMRHTASRGWLWLIGAGIATPTLWAVFIGSPGYARNVGYLAGPIAILAAIGGDRAIRWVCNRPRPIPAMAAVFVLLGGAVTFGIAEIEGRARAMILPDWSVATRALENAPRPADLRWIAPCRAHHWQVNWYRDPFDPSLFEAVPVGQKIEIVLGATVDRKGVPKIFRENAHGAGSHEIALPAYLQCVPPTSCVARVEWRRWIGARMAETGRPPPASDEPIFALIHLDGPMRTGDWTQFLISSDSIDNNMITFKAIPNGRGEIRSLILPARSMPAVRKAAQTALDESDGAIHFYTLSPLAN